MGGPAISQAFLGDLAVAMLPPGAAPILDTICCPSVWLIFSAGVRAMTSLPGGGGVGTVMGRLG